MAEASQKIFPIISDVFVTKLLSNVWYFELGSWYLGLLLKLLLVVLLAKYEEVKVSIVLTQHPIKPLAKIQFLLFPLSWIIQGVNWHGLS